MSITALGPAARKQAQAQMNAQASRQLDAMKVARARRPKVGSPGEERFAQQLAANWTGGRFAVGWTREARLIHGRKWRVDFAHHGYMIVVEIEGVTHAGGRHQRLKGFAEDCRKYNALALAGWMVLRFTPQQVARLTAIATVEEAIDAINRRRNLERETRERFKRSDTIAAMAAARSALQGGYPYPG